MHQNASQLTFPEMIIFSKKKPVNINNKKKKWKQSTFYFFYFIPVFLQFAKRHILFKEIPAMAPAAICLSLSENLY